jgi:hypothetical protein
MMCKNPERPNITTERIAFWASDGGDVRGMGITYRMVLEKRSKTRRKIACQRFDQKSASELAVNGESNIGGQLSG